MPWTVLLGKNEIIDCDAALVVEGEEVFRLREHRDGNLVVDFDVRAADGTRIAKVFKNHVVSVAPGYTFRHQRGVAEVVEESTGQVVARVEVKGPDTVAITGAFHVEGHKVEIRPDYLISGGTLLANTAIRGFGKAIELKRGSFGIGVSGSS